jgi:cysteinyl-tRNA synthetase
MLKLYNTLSRKIEEFKPINPPKVGMYICGPTVYDYAHIGHARTYTNSDVLVRALRWLDYEVKVVMNITDMGHLTSDADTGEDKLEKQARKEKRTAREVAEFYSQDFWQMAEQLNIIRPDVVCKATEHIKDMIELVKKLEKKGFSYRTAVGIYFDTAKLKDYGKLARLDAAGLQEGARVAKRAGKRRATDFALWKFSPKDVKRQMEWDSPWGIGFPGWHIECSAMSMKYLGESFDIHTGGVDHIPVHHSNEIAQSEAASGKRFVKYWFHSGFLMVEGEKMSKSLANFYRMEDVIKKGYQPLALRYLFLTSHYRTTMNFTWKALAAAAEAYSKLRSLAAAWQGKKGRTMLSEEKLAQVQRYMFRFREAVENDLAMPEALAVMWEMVKSNIPEQDKWELMVDWDQVLGLGLAEAKAVKIEIPADVQELAKKREAFRKEKRWEEADEIRKEIEEKGWLVQDVPTGTKIKKKSYKIGDDRRL